MESVLADKVKQFTRLDADGDEVMDEAGAGESSTGADIVSDTPADDVGDDLDEEVLRIAALRAGTMN